MAKIQPINIPTVGNADNFMLRSLPFDMEAKTCDFYYEIQKEVNGAYGIEYIPVLSGNISMNELEYANWGADNQYCIEWAANKLGITLI